MKHKQLLLAGLISSIALTLQSAPGLAVSLYSIDKEGNKLVTIDSSTGNVSIVGEVGFDVADVDLTLLNNKLYGTSGVFNGRWALYEFNTTTGAASLIANLSNDISLAEGLTTQNGKLIVGFNTNRTAFANRVGELSLTGSITNDITLPTISGFPSDTDGLTTSPDNKIYISDYRTGSSTNLLYTAGSTTPIGGYVSPNGVNDLTFVGNTLFGISNYSPTLAIINGTNGSLIQEVTLNRSGIYAGLAPVWATSVPEPSSTLGGGLVALALSIIQIIRRSAIHAKQIVLP